MLPRADMLAIKNPLGKLAGKVTRKGALILALTALLGWTACTPPGPRALLEGEALLRAGKPTQALEELKLATELLPQDPRAWNLLGLAYHRSGQAPMAVQAYRQALTRDRSNVVAVAHFNLGCLLLEQGNAAGAVNELQSYTLITNSVAGLLKLGEAQSRARQFNSAEAAYGVVLRQEPKNVEALNGLGVIHVQRGQRDAAQFFNAALQVNSRHGPALLNSAWLALQTPATKPLALQRYHAYLAAHAASPQAGSVKLIARQLEIELTPGPVVPKSNPMATLLPTNAPPTALVKSNPPVVVMKSNPVVLVTDLPVVRPTVPITVVTLSNDTPSPVAPVETIVTKPAATVVPAPSRAAPPVQELMPPELDSVPVVPAKKSGFFSRLNPFKAKPQATVPNNPATRVAVSAPMTNIPAAATADTAAAPKPSFPRYHYVSPPRPAPGHRGNSERALQLGLKAQREGNTNDAWLEFQLAATSDPSFFDAQYNAALLALQAGDLRRALPGWEMALALQPDSINARYNFGLALKQANYPHDAANELEKIITAQPDEARAHLALGNLYAQQLGEAGQARTHYVKVLELEPRNPQGAAIRFWLAAHP